ncbi:hypothetical protein NITHO_540001 [Nitrolancea hollandica Lb]|uniref:Uncharacterized protein n=1 Tax=Nitrolancea hollandica Lb TaxID=1129897 RepID=I4ELW6_9BACT|nr:hypothetical protein NITHO_540001 [Nitrolancea hollandica Lb]
MPSNARRASAASNHEPRPELTVEGGAKALSCAPLSAPLQIRSPAKVTPKAIEAQLFECRPTGFVYGTAANIIRKDGTTTPISSPRSLAMHETPTTVDDRHTARYSGRQLRI